MTLGNEISYLPGIAELRYLDWVALVNYGHLPYNLLEALLGMGAHLFFTSLLGVVFVYVIQKKHVMFKGWFYGLTLWFFV